MQRVPLDKHRVKPDNAPVAVGRALEEHRVAAGVSQAELAERIGIDQTGIGKIERGERSVTVTRLLELEDALQLQRGALLLAAGLVTVNGAEAAILGARELEPNHRELLVEQYRFFAARARARRRGHK